MHELNRKHKHVKIAHKNVSIKCPKFWHSSTCAKCETVLT